MRHSCERLARFRSIRTEKRQAMRKPTPYPAGVDVPRRRPTPGRRAARGRGRRRAGAPASAPPGQLAHGTERRGLRMKARPSRPPSATSAAEMPMPTWNASHRGGRRRRRHADRLARREPLDVGDRERALLRLRERDAPARGQRRRVDPRVDPAGELRRDDRAERGDAEQGRRARDRVVDPGRDAGVLLVGVGEHGRRERGDRRREPEREHAAARAAAASRSPTWASTRSSRSSPAAATSGPTPMNSRGPKRSASAPARLESTNITSVVGSVASPACSAV